MAGLKSSSFKSSSFKSSDLNASAFKLSLDTTPKQSTEEAAAGPPSLPLYLGGAVVMLCGILAANAALSEVDYGWVTDTLMLAGLGFLFSYGSRQLGITAHTLDVGFACALALLLGVFLLGPFSLTQFLPVGADTLNLRILFSLVLGGTVWSWALRSDSRVMLMAIPTMAALGMAATIDVNPQVLYCFGVFIFTVIFLLIHQNYLQNRSRVAASLGQSLPESAPAPASDLPRRLLGAQFVQAGLCGLVVLLAGLVVIVPAQAVFSHLSLAQAIRHLAAIRSGTAASGATLHFSDDDNLQIGTGDAWSASAEVVMRVTPSDGQPHLWRGRTYDQYSGDGWQSSLENDHDDVTEGEPVGDDRLSYPVQTDLTPGDPRTAGRDVLAASPLTAAFEVRGDTNQFYYAAPARQVIFDAGAAQGRLGLRRGYDGRLGLADNGSVHFPYQVISVPAPDLAQPGVIERLRQAGTQYPADVRRLYLGQSRNAEPEDLSFYRASVDEAFSHLPAVRHDPLDEALVLRDWVSARCVYTLTPPQIPEDADHVHYFLGESRRGYCDMFASSLAVLCRTAGIPARLATGFAPGDPDGGSFNLRAEDKHAWTEVYFPDAGWVALDATSGSRTDGTVPAAPQSTHTSWLAGLRQRLGADWGVIASLLAVIAAIVGYVLKTEVFDKRRTGRRPAVAASTSRLGPQGDLARSYALLSSALARLGLPRRASETPGEYTARVLPLLPALGREGGVAFSASFVTALTAAYTQALYADPALPSVSAPDLSAAAAEFAAAARRLQWQRFWARLTRRRISVQST